MVSYIEQLRDPRWQRLRLQQMESAGWQCAECGCRSKELNVHHYWYESRTAPWAYPNSCFAVLCCDCHKAWHASKLKIDQTIAGMATNSLHQVVGLAEGLRCATEGNDFFFEATTDALYVAAFVRGFWPPVDKITAIIDECCLRLYRKESFWFSSVLETVADCTDHSYIQAWLTATKKGEA